MEVLLNEAIKNYKLFLQCGNDEKQEEICYNLFDEADEKLATHYKVNYQDRDLLKSLVRYTLHNEKPISWVVENWYSLTGRKMKSIRQNWLKAKNKVEADELVFNDYYEEADNEVHRAKLDQDGYDVTEEYASDSV